MKPSELKRIEYWKQKYFRIIRFRLQNRLDEVYDIEHRRMFYHRKSILEKNFQM